MWNQLALSCPIQRVPRRSAGTPTSKSHLPHALSRTPTPTYHRISSSLSHQFPIFSHCSSALGIVLSCADAVVDAPPVLQGKCPSLLCGQKEGPCGAVDFTLHINSPIVPGASSSSSQLTAFCRLLSSNIFPILIRSTTNHRCSSQSPPLHQYSRSNVFYHNSPGNSFRQPRCLPLWVWISPIPSHPLSSREPSTLIPPLSLPPDYHLQQSYIQCMRKSGLNERL